MSKLTLESAKTALKLAQEKIAELERKNFALEADNKRLVAGLGPNIGERLIELGEEIIRAREAGIQEAVTKIIMWLRTPSPGTLCEHQERDERLADALEDGAWKE